MISASSGRNTRRHTTSKRSSRHAERSAKLQSFPPVHDLAVFFESFLSDGDREFEVRVCRSLQYSLFERMNG